MKIKILLLLFLCLSSVLFSQKSFEKSRIVAGVNWDLGVYKTEAYLNDFPTIKDDDGAVSSITSVWGEYGVTNWLGIGLKIARSKYFTEKDSVTNIQPTAASNDIGLQLSFHPVRTKKFDLPLVIVLGSSGFKRKSNDVTNTMASDVGTFYNLSINPRLFFGEKARFGMNLKIGLAGYTYNSMDISDNHNSLSNVYTLTGKGVNFMFGFQYNIK